MSRYFGLIFIMLIIEFIMGIIFLACNPFSLNHMSLWYPLMEPHLTTHNSSIGVWSRDVIELGTSTLV